MSRTTITTTKWYAACGVGFAVLMTLAVVLALAAALGGCASQAADPYSVTLRPVEFGRDQSWQVRWFDDGAQTVFTVHNDTDRDETLRVRCEGAPQDWVVRVSAHGEYHGLGQLMNRELHADPCRAEVVQ